MMRERICFRCGKIFHLPSENIFKVKFRGKVYECCGYTCRNRLKEEFEVLKKTSKGGKNESRINQISK